MTSLKNDSPSVSSAPVIRVCVVEDDDVVREQLADHLNCAPGITCVGSQCSAEQAMKVIPALQPDVVLMDINLPKMSGIDCVRQLKQQLPDTKYIMLTVYEDSDAIFKSLLAGAVGYLLKGRVGSNAHVLAAVRDAVHGGSPLNSLIARKIVGYFHNRPVRPGAEQLISPREREVLELLSKGLLYKDIAGMLNVSIETVRKHCHNIYEKLHVSSRTEAVVKFLGKENG
jgi:DNA-binding NarL/FixJ family response regulator